MGPAREEATTLGMPDLCIVELPHPLNALTPEAARKVAEGYAQAAAASLAAQAPLLSQPVQAARSSARSSSATKSPPAKCEGEMCDLG